MAKPDVLLISKDAKKLRNNISGFLPNIGLSMIDYQRNAEIDRFYNLCQNHRDYYKEYTGRIPKVTEFNKSTKMYASRPDPTSIYVLQPIRYVKESHPPIYPLTTERRGKPNNSGLNIMLNGQYNSSSCIRYKR